MLLLLIALEIPLLLIEGKELDLAISLLASTGCAYSLWRGFSVLGHLIEKNGLFGVPPIKSRVGPKAVDPTRFGVGFKRVVALVDATLFFHILIAPPYLNPLSSGSVSSTGLIISMLAGAVSFCNKRLLANNDL